MNRRHIIFIITGIAITAGILTFVFLQNREVLARVNGVPIKNNQLLEIIDNLKPEKGWDEVHQEKLLQLKKEVLDLLIDEELLIQEVKRRHIKLSGNGLAPAINDEDSRNRDENLPEGVEPSRWRRESRKRLLIEKLIYEEMKRSDGITEADVRQYYEAHKDKFTIYPMVRAYQIFLKDRKRAEEVNGLVSQGEDFSGLAREWSLSPEAEKGGDLGFVRKGELPPDMEDQIFSMAAGEVSPVIKSSYGYHIFKIAEVIESKGNEFYAVQNDIRNRLLQERQRKALQEWLKEAKTKARITVYETMLSKNKADPQARLFTGQKR